MDLRIDGFVGSVKLGPTGKTATRAEEEERRCRKLTIYRLKNGKYALILGANIQHPDEEAWVVVEEVAKIIMRLLWGGGEGDKE